MKKRLFIIGMVFVIALSAIPLSEKTPKAAAPQAKYSKCRISAPGSVKAGKSFKVTFIGDRVNAKGGIEGETKILPTAYMIFKNKKDIGNEIWPDDWWEWRPMGTTFTKTFKIKTPGRYVISADYELFTYNKDYGFDEDSADFLGEKDKVINVLGQKYKIKFNANKGSVSKKSKKVQAGKKYGKLPTPKRNRYKFKGWYTKKSGGTKVTKNTTIKNLKKHTLYAHWFGPKGRGRTITKAEYKRIKTGMSYSSVKYLIGGPGTCIASSSVSGYHTKIYSWNGSGSVGANANVTFQNGKVVSKAQYGLR